MGMESFQIIVLPEGVEIYRENGYWYLNGSSNIRMKEFEKKLKQVGAVNDKNMDWIYDDCIEIRVEEENGSFQGLEIRGCFSWIRAGVDACFQLMQDLKKEIPFEIFIMYQKVEGKNAEELYRILTERYQKKIENFYRQFPHMELKVTCSEFYKEIDRQNRWYYKILKSWKEKQKK